VCNVNAQNEYGGTALIFVACSGHTEIVKLILQKDRSSIDVQNVDKGTALMGACWNGHAAVIELLIRSGANLDLKDKNNKTAFDWLDERGDGLSQAEKTRLKDLPRLIRQEQLQQQQQKKQTTTTTLTTTTATTTNN
jgi:hypothetical protein